MNELITVEINENNEQIVSARLLHGYLEIKTKFNDWIDKRIEKYEFTENVDFVAVTQKKVTAQGNSTEYKDYLNLSYAATFLFYAFLYTRLLLK